AQRALRGDPLHVRSEKRVDRLPVTGLGSGLQHRPKLPRDLRFLSAHGPILDANRALGPTGDATARDPSLTRRPAGSKTLRAPDAPPLGDRVGRAYALR